MDVKGDILKFEYLDIKSNYMKEVVHQDIDFLKSSLGAQEELQGLSVGVFQENYGIYGVTNQRLLFCSVANGRKIIKEYRLQDITEVKLARTGLYNIRFAIQCNWHRLGITWQAAKDFHQFLQAEIDTKRNKAA